VAAIVPVLFPGAGRRCQRERAALGVPAHGPPIAGVDDRAAEFADALDRRGQVGDGEVGQAGGVAGARSPPVDSETQAVGVGLPSGSGRGGPWREGDPEDSVPEVGARSGSSAGNSISGAGMDGVWPGITFASSVRRAAPAVGQSIRVAARR
jgi:hypothetical protein